MAQTHRNQVGEFPRASVVFGQNRPVVGCLRRSLLIGRLPPRDRGENEESRPPVHWCDATCSTVAIPGLRRLDRGPALFRLLLGAEEGVDVDPHSAAGATVALDLTVGDPIVNGASRDARDAAGFSDRDGAPAESRHECPEVHDAYHGARAKYRRGFASESDGCVGCLALGRLSGLALACEYERAVFAAGRPSRCSPSCLRRLRGAGWARRSRYLRHRLYRAFDPTLTRAQRAYDAGTPTRWPASQNQPLPSERMSKSSAEQTVCEAGIAPQALHRRKSANVC